MDFITVDDKIPFEEEFKANGSNVFRITPRYVSVKNYKKDIDKVFKMRHYDVLWFNKTTLSSIDCLKAAKKMEFQRLFVIVTPRRIWVENLL